MSNIIQPNGNSKGPEEELVRGVPCMECGQEIFAATPEFEFLNSAKQSVIVMTHKQPILCTGCGSLYTFQITDASEIHVALACIKKGERKIIMPQFGGVAPRIG